MKATLGRWGLFYPFGDCGFGKFNGWTLGEL